jgi:hypothetical protein
MRQKANTKKTKTKPVHRALLATGRGVKVVVGVIIIIMKK